MKTSKELLKGLVESYSSNENDVLINKNFIEGINKFLDSLDSGSIFGYTLNEISFCGMEGRNNVTVVINGTKGQTFTKNEKFSITFEENCNATIISKYTNRSFRFDGDRMQQEIIMNLISFNREILCIKVQMSEIFEKIYEGVKNLLGETELQIKWCDTNNSKLMISDKEGNDFFLIEGEKIEDGKMLVVGKACKMFNWESIERANNLDVLDIFMNTNDLCNKIVNKMEKQDLIRNFEKIESSFPGYSIHDIEEYGETVIVLVTNTMESPEANKFRNLTNGANIVVSVYDDEVYVAVDDADEDEPLHSISFNWDGTEKNFKDNIDKYIFENIDEEEKEDDMKKTYIVYEYDRDINCYEIVDNYNCYKTPDFIRSFEVKEGDVWFIGEEITASVYKDDIEEAGYTLEELFDMSNTELYEAILEINPDIWADLDGASGPIHEYDNGEDEAIIDVYNEEGDERLDLFLIGKSKFTIEGGRIFLDTPLTVSISERKTGETRSRSTGT